MRFHIKSSSYHHYVDYAYYYCTMPTIPVLCLFITTTSHILSAMPVYIELSLAHRI